MGARPENKEESLFTKMLPLTVEELSPNEGKEAIKKTALDVQIAGSPTLSEENKAMIFSAHGREFSYVVMLFYSLGKIDETVWKIGGETEDLRKQRVAVLRRKMMNNYGGEEAR